MAKQGREDVGASDFLTHFTITGVVRGILKLIERAVPPRSERVVFLGLMAVSVIMLGMMVLLNPKPIVLAFAISGLLLMLSAGLVAFVIAGRSLAQRQDGKEMKLPDGSTARIVPTAHLSEESDLNELLRHVAPSEPVLVAGRTLVSWAELARQGSTGILSQAVDRGVEFRFVMMDPLTYVAQLPQEERDVLERDLQPSLQTLARFCDESNGKCQLKLTTDLIHDSVTSIMIEDRGHILHQVTLDINTDAERHPPGSAQIEKWTVVFHGGRDSVICERLRARTKTLFDHGGRYLRDRDLSNVLVDMRDGLARHPHDPSRRNTLRSLLPGGRLTAILGAFDARKRQLLRLPESLRPAVTPPPVCVQVEITDRCGRCHCVMCGRHTWRPVDMPTALFRKLVQSLAALGTTAVILSGGEPFAHPDLDEILATSAEAGIRLGVLTNGLGLRDYLAHPGLGEQRARSLSKACDWIRASVDGATDDQFEAVRRPSGCAPPGGWISAILGSLRSVREAAEIPTGGPQLDVCFTLCRPNVTHFDEMLGLYRANRVTVDACYMKFAHGSHLAGVAASRGEVERVLEAARDLVAKGDSDVRIGRSRADLRCTGTNLDFLVHFIETCGIDGIATGVPFAKTEQPNCFVPFMFSLVDASGRVYPCCHVYPDNLPSDSLEPHYPPLGDLGSQSFEAIWLGDGYEEFRRRMCDSGSACGNAQECTRHHFPNQALDWLYSSYYAPLSRTSWLEVDRALRSPGVKAQAVYF
jgi:hypothetical protein